MGSVYYYCARNTEGAIVRGAVEALDEAAALAALRTRALFVTALSAEGSAANVMTFRRGVSRDALAAFFRSFATMIGAGMPISRALQVGAEQTRCEKLAEALTAVHDDITAGAPLGEALARRPKEFTAFTVAMVRAGESGGVLDIVLERLAQLLEDARTTHKRIAAALVYPAILLVTAGLLVVFLLTFILPMFAALYGQLHVPLPWETAFLLNLAAVLSAWKGQLAATGVILIAVAAGLQSRYGKTFHRIAQEKAHRIPAIGMFLRKAVLAQLARNLGTLLRSGVDLLCALDIVSGIVQNPAYAQSLRDMRGALREGGSFCATMAQSELYDPMFVQMVSIGEESGSLDAMLLRIASYYDVDVEAAVAALSSTLEPVLMLVLGGIIALIVFALFIPLYTLIGNIT